MSSSPVPTDADLPGRRDTPAPGGGTARRALLLTAAALVLVIVLVWGVGAWRYARSHERTDDAQVDGRIIPVLAKVGGYVTRVAVEENDSVRAGALLVQIDKAEYSQRVSQTDAELAAAQAMAGEGRATGQAEALVASATGERAATEAQLVAARANAARAQADLARGEELARREIIPRQQLDALRAAALAGEAAVQAAEARAAAAGSSIASAEAGVRLAQARVAAARVMSAATALQLTYTTVTAPERGTVSRRVVEVGQLVQPGQPLFAIVADSGAWVTANFKETQVAEMRVGQPVELEVDAYDGCHATGRVQSIASATGAKFALLPPDNATGNFTKVVQRISVRIMVTEGCGPDRPLRPGMSLTVSVRTR